jgi:hypothetical protein
MRVYLPSTLPELAAALKAGRVNQTQGFAVTPALREAYASGDQEELEYIALTAAAGASLRLLATDPDAPTRRVVLAAEVPDSEVTSMAISGDPAQVTLRLPVPLAKVVSGHVDDQQATTDIRDAIEALPAADAGDDDAMFAVDQADGHELAWYASQELPHIA